MAKRNETSAYDFTLFEAKPAEEPKRQPKQDNIIEIPKEHLVKTVKGRRRVRNRGAVKKAILLVIGAAICLFLVFGQVRLAELTEQIETTQQELTEAESLYTQYQMRSDSQLSLTSIEEFATKNLGMAKAEQTQMEYIELSSSDKGEVVQSDNDNWLASAWRFVVNLLS